MAETFYDDTERAAANPPKPPRKLRGPTTEERIDDRYQGDPIGPRQTLVVTNAVARLTVPPGTRSASITVETNPVRFTVDGTAPTAAIGSTVAAGSMLKVTGWASLTGIAFFRAGAADATLQVEYFN